MKMHPPLRPLAISVAAAVTFVRASPASAAMHATKEFESGATRPKTGTPAEPTAAQEPKKAVPTILDQLGGISGLVSSTVPVVVFVLVNVLTSLTPAVIAALAVAIGIAVWRLVRREALQPAVSGLFGVGICAFIAYRTGQAKRPTSTRASDGRARRPDAPPRPSAAPGRHPTEVFRAHTIWPAVQHPRWPQRGAPNQPIGAAQPYRRPPPGIGTPCPCP